MSTNTFDESKVRREQGKFAEKPHSEAEIDLGTAASSSPVDSADARARAAAKLDRIAPNWSEYIIRQNDDDGSFELGTVFDAAGNDIDLNEDDAWEVTCDVSYIDSDDPALKSVDRDPYDGFRATVERDRPKPAPRPEPGHTDEVLRQELSKHSLEQLNALREEAWKTQSDDTRALNRVRMAISKAMMDRADQEVARRFPDTQSTLAYYDSLQRNANHLVDTDSADRYRSDAAMRRLEEDLGLQTWQEDVLVDKIEKDNPGFGDLSAAESNRLWHEATMREAQDRMESMGLEDQR